VGRAPGTATEAQRHQATRVANVHDPLQEWMHGFGLPEDHLVASEVLAVGTTFSRMPEAQTLLVAQMITWLSVLDEVLDTQDLSSAPLNVYRSTRLLLFLLHPPCPRSLKISYPGWSYRCPQADLRLV
jgi:hypothetical protein